jgi:hypothetical protein
VVRLDPRARRAQGTRGVARSPAASSVERSEAPGLFEEAFELDDEIAPIERLLEQA